MTPASAAAEPGLAARPFLKWAGGKRQLLPELRRYYPHRVQSYAEPFLGSGAVFFDLAARGVLRGARVRLTDRNEDLVACYRAIRDQVEEVIARLRVLEARHRRDPELCFYRVRDQQFNPLRRARAERGRSGPPADEAELAALLIYLNRTCFNGLYRLNAQGDFNTPMGRYANPAICDASNLRAVSRLLGETAAAIEHADFASAAEGAGAGAMAYFDPPYDPVSPTANFRSYTSRGFSAADQERLQAVVLDLAGQGARVLVSNSVTPLTTRLYARNDRARAVGLVARRVPARRAINSRAAGRGAVQEYIVSNVPPRRRSF
ncbi:MAG: Dam family site-specific DNA-(adenine-N6)-methyltransferase [Vicinamibacterales bacterium]